jgi:hypothetical protein
MDKYKNDPKMDCETDYLNLSYNHYWLKQLKVNRFSGNSGKSGNSLPLQNKDTTFVYQLVK